MSNAANETTNTDGQFAKTIPSLTESESPRLVGASEQLITLTEAAKLLPRVNGRKPAVCTLWRWCRKGLRGQFLAYVRVGRRICTTRQAMLRFFTDLAEIDQQHGPAGYSKPTSLKRKSVTSRERQRALAEADRILEEVGI